MQILNEVFLEFNYVKKFVCSLTILDDDKIDLLFGLDMLKRHKVDNFL